MLCTHCKTENPDDTRECRHCGTRLILPQEGPTEALVNPPTLKLGEGETLRPSGEPPSSLRFSTLQAGSDFGPRYKILEILGEGGMGTVYRAHDRELDREVALKLIRPSLSANPNVIERFKREILLASKVSHKNVLRIHDLGDVGGIKYISMNYIDGEDLSKMLRRSGPLPADTVVRIIEQLCSALKAAHDEGVIHRDLKPQNVMIAKDGTAYITDFGIARAADAETSSLTTAGAVVGTPQYMSPEQVKGEKLDARSDIYSLGLILYEVLTGDVAFKGDTTLEVLMKRVNQKPPDPRQLNPRVPDYLARITKRCLEPDVRLRYQSAAEILEDLKQQRVTLSLTAEIRRRATPRNFVVVLLLLVAILGLLWYRESSRRTGESVNQPPTATLTLAILPLQNATGDPGSDWLSMGLAEMLITDLGQLKTIRPVSSSRLYQILSDLKLLDQRRYDPAIIQTIAELTSASAILSGQFYKLGATIRVDALLNDLKSGRETTIKVEAGSDLTGLVDALAERVRGSVTVSPESIKTEVYKKLSEVTTKSPEALRLYNQGLFFMHQGNHLQAASQFEEATKIDASFAMAYAKLAQAQSNLGYGDRAEESASKAAQYAIGLPPSEYYNIVAARARIANDHEKAIEAYKKLLASFPNDVEAYFNLGSVYEASGQWDQAIEHYRKVIELDPKYADALGALARATIKKGAPQQALEYLNQLLVLNHQLGNEQGRATALHSIGVAYKRLKKYDEALRYYRESLEIKRKIGDKRGVSSSLSEMGQVYQFTDRYDEALKTYQQALAISSGIGDRKGVGDDLNNLGSVMEQLGRYDDALAYYKRALNIAIERGAKDEIALRLGNIGQVYSQVGQYEDAYAYFTRELEERRALGDKRGIANSLVGLGDLLVSQGRYEDALKHHLEALSLWREIGESKGVALTSLSIADVFEAQGRYSAALKSAIEAEVTVKALGSKRWQAYALGRIGHIQNLLGATDFASQRLMEAESLAREIGSDEVMAEVFIYKGEGLRVVGQLSQAKEMFMQARGLSNKIKNQSLFLNSAIHLGSLQAETGELTPAEATLTRALRDAGKADLKPLSVKIGVELGRVHLLQKKYGRAASEAADAIKVSKQLGLNPQLVAAYHLQGKISQAQGSFQEAMRSYKQSLDALNLVRDNIEDTYRLGLLRRKDIEQIYRDAIRLFKEKGREDEISAYLRW